MKLDTLWSDGPRFYQCASVFKIGTDSLQLARFVNAASARKAMDLGTGTGVLAILLALANEKLQLDAIDISPQAVELTSKNAQENNVTAQVFPQVADMREIKGRFPAGGYDLVIANPPYFAVNTGKRAQGDIADAREESCCSLDDITKAAAYLLRAGGNFALVHRPERLSELCVCMTAHNIQPKRLQFAFADPTKPPSLIFLEGKRGAKPGLKIEAPLLLQR